MNRIIYDVYDYRRLTPEEKCVIVAERLARGYPPHSPPHLKQDRSTFLLTAACYEHTEFMSQEDRRAALMDLLFEEMINAGNEFCAWVILPNHYHLLVTVEEFDSLSGIFKRVHGRTARAWNMADQQPGRKIWYRFSDRLIRSEGHYYAALNYIHYNPVKHGWVHSPYHWQASSVHWYKDTFGRDWLRATWQHFPVKDFGHRWDDWD